MSKIHKPCVYWITGLPGTGKSTLAKWLNSYLITNNVPVIWLDGDVMRENLFQEFGYEVSERHQLAIKYHNLTKIIVEQGITVIISTVSLFHEIQKMNRDKFENYHEIFLEMNLKLLERGPRRMQYGTENVGESPRLIQGKPLSPSLHLFAESESERTKWASILEKYIESI